MSLWYRLLNNNSIFNNRGVKLLSGKGPHAAHLTSIIIGKGWAEGQGGRGRGWGYFGHTSKVTWRPELDPPPSGLDLARVPYVWHPCSITTSFIFVFCSTMRQSAFNKKRIPRADKFKRFLFWLGKSITGRVQHFSVCTAESVPSSYLSFYSRQWGASTSHAASFGLPHKSTEVYNLIPWSYCNKGPDDCEWSC